MNKVSILFDSPENPQLVPLRESLKDSICAFYGVRSLHSNKQFEENVFLSTIPDIVGGIFGRLASWHLVPPYWAYWYKKRALDRVWANRIAKDDSKIFYTSSLFKTSIKKAKKAGKIIVIREGNSEAGREYERVVSEYNLFHIRHRYVYGDRRFRDCRLKSLSYADYVIAITDVARKTYELANNNMDRFVLIPSTGTNWSPQLYGAYQGKPKAFISTAFHSFIKGTHRLLLAWRKSGIQGIPLIIAGRLCEDIQEFIDNNGPFENVIFAGHQNNLQEFYNKYDAVGVLLSLSEGAGRVTPEMMSFGFPMIVSPDATCDLVTDGYNGLIVEPTDDDAIATKLKYFADDWNRVYELRDNALHTVSKWTVKDHSLGIASYLRNLLNKCSL